MAHQSSTPIKGFTLVELAIVMTIIGLLIGGVLKGQELLTNARVKRVISDVQGIQAALQTFRDKYGQWPGDMSTADNRIAGCSAANACTGGDGNNIIAEIPVSAWLASYGEIASEQTQAWKHLALADLIVGVDPTATNPAWGQSHPKSTFAGGFHFSYGDAQTPDAMGRAVEGPGHWLRMQASLPVGGVASDPFVLDGTTGAGAVSARVAAIIDRQMDDGLPNSGLVWGNERHISHPDCGANDPFEYDEQASGQNCLLWLKAF